MLTSFVPSGENALSGSMPIGKHPVNMRFAVFIYDGVEPVDLATYGVLSMARRIAPQISMFTVAPAGRRSQDGQRPARDRRSRLCGLPAFRRDDRYRRSGLGGAVRKRAETLDFIRRYAPGGVVAGVCTGGMILAASGLLDGCKATTKREIAGAEVPPVRIMRERHPRIDVQDAASLVDCGGWSPAAA